MDATYWGVALFVAAFLVGSILTHGNHKIYYQFLEGHSVTALSSAFMAMTAGLAWACHLGRPREPAGWFRWFWPAFSLGFLFFSLDEILEFHEGLGSWMKTALGSSETFRNWNDAVVVGYGVVALIALAAFLPEVLRYPRFAELLATGFGFFVVHTAIDSLMTSSSKNIPEESAKLFATAFFALAALTVVMTLQQSGQRELGAPSQGDGKPKAAGRRRR